MEHRALPRLPLGESPALKPFVAFRPMESTPLLNGTPKWLNFRSKGISTEPERCVPIGTLFSRGVTNRTLLAVPESEMSCEGWSHFYRTLTPTFGLLDSPGSLVYSSQRFPPS